MEAFLKVWEPYFKELFWFVDYELSKYFEGTGLPEEDSGMKTRREFIFSQVSVIQKILLDVDEKHLVVEPMYHWNELRIKYPQIKDIGFKTPFSYLTHWVSLPHLKQLVEEQGFRECLFISVFYLELLKHATIGNQSK
ncbi:TPA: hypothetical protein IHK17_001863 [Escherichia coli]|uniref:hypothetical protein n=1 Tax=unclassified Enterobacter cloacae complex TaxID=2757714 RepID=UPI0019CC6C02|nr:hypothetical protein [Citrobacter koseri]HAO2190945.1 hypothetical protein [Escherichia coli]HBS8273152.1 hypothetical protein [Klebsiella pneumoniae]HCE8853915.1 hypothetical protein [Citrobacter freundii]HCE8956033.1 hypothetical protein [Raoultella ornithinolytica]